MDETLLPPSVLAKASVRGGEYAWAPDDVEEAVRAGQQAQLLPVGGQFQFRLPDGICEMYWLSAEAPLRQNGEAWREYIERAADAVLERFRAICSQTDFIAEARGWPFLAEKMVAGVDVLVYLCFVIYFNAEECPQEPSQDRRIA